MVEISMKLREFNEYLEQVAFFKWAALAQQSYPELKYHLRAWHNTQKLTLAQQKRYKAAGGKSASPDIVLLVSRHNYHGLFLEFKSPSLKPKTTRGKGGLSPEQQEFFPLLEKEGYKVVVCYSWIEAKQEIESYLS